MAWWVVGGAASAGVKQASKAGSSSASCPGRGWSQPAAAPSPWPPGSPQWPFIPAGEGGGVGRGLSLEAEGRDGGRERGGSRNQQSSSLRMELSQCLWLFLEEALRGQCPRPLPTGPSSPLTDTPTALEGLLNIPGGCLSLPPIHQPRGLTPLPVPGSLLRPMVSPGEGPAWSARRGCGVRELWGEGGTTGPGWAGWWRGQGPGLGPGWGRGRASLLGHGAQELLHVGGQQVVHLVALAEEGGRGCGSRRGLTRPGRAQLLPRVP